jgi:ferrochelatase
MRILMDKYVIDVPFLLRALLVRGIILQTRPKKSAAAYAKYGGTKVHHLWLFLDECMKKLNNLLMYLFHLPCVMEILRYYLITEFTCNRSDALYPQHAMASTTTILELAEEHRQKYFQE